MRLNRLDLNLLVALEALLSRCSVTAAANALHVTQPSMSASLSRLREHFTDQLLVPAGRRMQLTPLGEMLQEPVRALIDQIEATVAIRPLFDASTSRRHFSVAASEFVATSLLVPVAERAYGAAPGVTLEIAPADPVRVNERFLRHDLDFNFTNELGRLSDHPSEQVIHEEFSCVVWRGNTRVGKALSVDDFLSLGHVVTRYGFAQAPGFEQYALTNLGIRRRVEVTCITPIMLGHFVVGTQRIATLPTRLARVQAKSLSLRILKPPIELPALRIFMQWHKSRDLDSATAWFRDLVQHCAQQQELTESAGPASGAGIPGL